MSSDNGTSTTSTDATRQRRGSMSTSAFTNLFRNNSVSQSSATPFPTPLASTAVNDQRRRLSVSTLGLAGTSPTTPSALLRRASLSTNSDSIDENAVEDDESTRTGPATPFTRRMSFSAAQAMRGARGPVSPGTNGTQPMTIRRRSTLRGSPPTPPLLSASFGGYAASKMNPQASTANQSRAASDLCSPSARSDQGFNWSDQLRSRAESSVTSGSRPSFSFASGLGNSPPRAGQAPPPPATSRRDRAASVSDLPAPPAQAPKARPKPDAFQERILKGDFYMD